MVEDDYCAVILGALQKPPAVREALSYEIKEAFPNIPLFKIRADLELEETPLKTISCVAGSYESFVRELDKFRINTGYPELDEKIRGIAPGEVLGVMARTAVGKTTFALNIIERVLSNQKVPVLFFSLEQEAPQVFERLAAIVTKKEPVAIEKLFKNNLGSDIIGEMLSKYQKFLVVDKGALAFSEMGELLSRAREGLSERVSLVVIDYIGYMRGKGKDCYERASNLAKEAKEFAKRYNVALIVLCQLSREGGTGGEPVSLKMARDSGVLEESFDYILGLWRPELSDKVSEPERASYEGIFKVAILKNRSGKMGIVGLRFKPEILRIEEDERRLD